jgi:hypothetical protein
VAHAAAVAVTFCFNFKYIKRASNPLAYRRPRHPREVWPLDFRLVATHDDHRMVPHHLKKHNDDYYNDCVCGSFCPWRWCCHVDGFDGVLVVGKEKRTATMNWSWATDQWCLATGTCRRLISVDLSTPRLDRIACLNLIPFSVDPDRFSRKQRRPRMSPPGRPENSPRIALQQSQRHTQSSFENNLLGLAHKFSFPFIVWEDNRRLHHWHRRDAPR